METYGIPALVILHQGINGNVGDILGGYNLGKCVCVCGGVLLASGD